MNSGRVEQFDTPINVYDHPSTLFVSGFIGTTNLLPGRALQSSSGTMLVELDAGARVAVPSDRVFAAGALVVLSARPEQLCLHGEPATSRWRVHRRLSVPLGPNTIHDLETHDGATLKLVESRHGVPVDLSGEAWCGLRPEARPGLFDRVTPS